jgi:hypothetical protein
VGLAVGTGVGDRVGCLVGLDVGTRVGVDVGFRVGLDVGSGVGHHSYFIPATPPVVPKMTFIDLTWVSLYETSVKPFSPTLGRTTVFGRPASYLNSTLDAPRTDRKLPLITVAG